MIQKKTPLVPIEASDSVVIRLAYASPDNVTGRLIYDPAKAQAYLHPQAVLCLNKAVGLAEQQNTRLCLLDAFRPREAQWILWQHHPDEQFVAHPEKGSPHARGTAIDVTLLDQHNAPLDMGTPFDDFTARAHHGTQAISHHAQANRYLLLGIMMSAGWDFFRNEWWHYQLFNSKAYPLYDDACIPNGMMHIDALNDATRFRKR